MNSIEAFVMGEMNRDKESMVFDWDKAATLINENKPCRVSAGLHGDWEYTGGKIFDEDHIIPDEDTYTYLSSTWAIPEINIDGDVQSCYIMRTEAQERWGNVDFAKLYWPVSALKILNEG